MRDLLTDAALASIPVLIGLVVANHSTPPQAPPFKAQMADSQLPPTMKLDATMQARTQRIEAELLELGGQHEWAGRYRTGPGLYSYSSVLLAPRSGYVLEWG